MNKTNCLQICLLRIFPHLSMDEINDLSGYVHSKYTWPTKTMIWLMKNNYDFKLISKFDYFEFARFGVRYLKKRYNPAIVEHLIKMSNVFQARVDAGEFYDITKGQNVHINRPASIDDVISYIDNGYFVIVPFYARHFVVATDYFRDDIGATTSSIHKDFENAFQCPTKRDASILAIRKF